MKMNRIGLFITFSSFIIILIFTSRAFSVTSKVFPAQISVNSLYHGSRIAVTGEADAGEDIIIKLSSPERKVHLRQKGKRGGLLWMNVGELEFNPVSDVYLLYSTRDINLVLSDDQQDKYAIGYNSFKRRVEVSPVSDTSEKKKWIDEFLRFKEKNRVYGEFEGMIETDVDGNMKRFKLTADWPYQAPPQDYVVSVYAVKNNLVQDYTQTSLTVKTVGALKFISGLAFNRASLYGIASILIAIAAGFIVSVIFKGGGGSH